VEDSEHTFDYALQQHVYNDHQPSSSDTIDPNHEHQFHAHVSCLTGYSIVSKAIPYQSIAIEHISPFFDSNDKQPPTPPPNA
jgi:hypothetical protein